MNAYAAQKFTDHQGKEIEMSDYAVVTAPGTVRIERLLPGSIERLWSYLTDPDKRAQWFAAGDMELKVGGRVQLVFRNSELTRNDDPAPAKYAAEAGEVVMTSRIVECEPPRVLAYTFGGETSVVRFELTPRGNKVQLVITHGGLENFDGMTSIAGGWHTHLDILGARLEGREPEGFWRLHTRLEAEYAKRLRA
jgi:uncharacterized protein YndB with AHSA1/START domain